MPADEPAAPTLTCPECGWKSLAPHCNSASCPWAACVHPSCSSVISVRHAVGYRPVRRDGATAYLPLSYQS